MQPSNFFALVAVLAATASAQSTTTATVLLPDWCVTDRNPSVTAWEQGGLTTYSYSCSTDSSAMSSASARATGEAESARNRASEILASIGRPQETDRPDREDRDRDNDNDRRSLNNIFQKRDDDTCYGWGGALNVCIPWEITQGPSIWAVHYTATNVAALDQECSFGNGGVASGPATCTASGRLDPKVWGNGDGIKTHVFDSHEINWYWIRDVVVATAGAPAATGAGATTGSFQGDSNRATVSGAQSTGMAAPRSIPSSAVAMLAGAGGILAAAIAL